MPDPRAQRTLVKSPPELWAEVSDATTLARHLGDFGEIRITSLEAERTVVWEGDTARGTVQIEPSGWGTKVTLTAEAIEQSVEEAAAETPTAESPAAPEAVVEPEPVAVVEEEPVTPEPVAAPPKRGLFARLFGRRARVVAELPAPVEPEPVAEAPEPEPEPVPEPVVEPVLTGEITAAKLSDERVAEVLVGVLDDLGSAHHRPFSRG